MSLVEPPIDELLNQCDDNPFLLCTIASKRSKEVNDMILGQRDRALTSETALSLALANKKTPLKIAFDEIARGDISYLPIRRK